MNAATTKIWNALKEKRFTGTARVLGGKLGEKANVIVVNNKGQPPAWCDASGRIVINDAVPAQRNEKLSLVWERGKLYHEILHLLFTTDDEMRAELANKSSDRDKYLWISNALEDGRIEYHGAKMYEGITYYIRTVLQDLIKANSAMSGLLIYVRTKLWRNSQEEKFWSKYQTLIDESITAKESRVVWMNAWEIVQDMVKNAPPKPKPEDIDSPVNVLPANEDDQGDAGESGEGQDSGGSGEDAGEDSGENEDTSENEDSTGLDEESGEESGEEEDFDDTIGHNRPPPPDDGGSASDSGDDEGEKQETPDDSDDVPRTIDKKVREAIEDMIEEALSKVDAEVRDELVQLKDELANFEAPQEYDNMQEETQAGELGELFASLQVESTRQKYTPTKYGGSLDGRRLCQTRTDGVFMHERNEKLSQPHIVLCIDESCSMEGQRDEVSEAARVLNGGIKASGAKSIVFSFGGSSNLACIDEEEDLVTHAVVPREGFKCQGYHTPTHLALEAAFLWLERETARRGMVIVVTDGSPDNAGKVGTAFEQLKESGYYVLNVLLGCFNNDDNLRIMCHQFVKVKDAKNLVRDLEPPLADFMAGLF